MNLHLDYNDEDNIQIQIAEDTVCVEVSSCQVLNIEDYKDDTYCVLYTDS